MEGGKFSADFFGYKSAKGGMSRYDHYGHFAKGGIFSGCYKSAPPRLIAGFLQYSKSWCAYVLHTCIHVCKITAPTKAGDMGPFAFFSENVHLEKS